MPQKLTAKQVANILLCCIRTDQVKHFPFRIKVGNIWESERVMVQWGTDDIGYYSFTFTFNKNLKPTDPHCIMVMHCRTPKGLEYSRDIDEPCKYLKTSDMKSLHMLLSKRNDGIVPEVRCVYQVVIDGVPVGPMYDKGLGKKGKAFPKELKFNEFETEDLALNACDKLIVYLLDLDEKTRRKNKF